MNKKYISIFITLSLFATLAEAKLTIDEKDLKRFRNMSFTYNAYDENYDSISNKLNNLLIEPKDPSVKPQFKAIFINGKVNNFEDFFEKTINMNNIKILVEGNQPNRAISFDGISVKESNVEVNNLDIISDFKNYYGVVNTNNDTQENVDKEVKSKITINHGDMTFNGDESRGIFTQKFSTNNDSLNEVEINNSNMTFNGNLSYGIWSENSSVIMNDSNINLNGSKNVGVFAKDNAHITIDGSSTIYSEKDDAIGIILGSSSYERLDGAQIVTINNSKIETFNSTAIYSKIGNGIVNIDNGSKVLSNILIDVKNYNLYEKDIIKVTLNVSNGSSVEGYTLTADETTSSINLLSNSTWNVTGNSVLTNLNVTDSVVNFKKDDDKFITTEVDTLDGSNATYNFAVDIVENNGSKLIINKSSNGKNIAQVTNDGGQNTTGNEKILLVEDRSGENAKATFTSNKTIELGGYAYTVQRDGDTDNWVVIGGDVNTKPTDPTDPTDPTGPTDPTDPTGPISPGKPTINNTAKSITGLTSSSYLLNQAELTTLRQRMGDLITDKTTSSTDVSGVWGRVYGGRYKTRDNANLAKLSMNYYGFQLGGDSNTIKEGNNKNYLGAFVGHTTGKPDFYKGDSTVESWYGGLYNTFITEDNFYIDSVFKFGQYRNKYHFKDSEERDVNGKVNSNVLTLSSEIGKRFILTSNDAYNLYLEPQAQLTWSRIGSFKTRASNELNVKQNAYNSTIGRLGALFGSQINKQSDVYLKASYLHEFKKDVKYKLNTSEESYNVQGNGVEIGIGGNVKLNENGYLYLEANYINSHAHYTGSKFNVGYRYSF